MALEGSVKVNDVGKLYELFMKDDDHSEILFDKMEQ